MDEAILDLFGEIAQIAKKVPQLRKLFAGGTGVAVGGRQERRLHCLHLGCTLVITRLALAWT